MRSLSRFARTVTLAVALAWLLYVLASWLLAWNPADAGAYYDAAHRLRSGDPLYAPSHPEAHELYRYAPWFAYAWIPMTYLPRDLALHSWSLAMLVSSAVAIWPLVRHRTHASLALAALLGAFLAETAMFGNAHPAVVALLVAAAGRAGIGFPLAVGVATSIKLVPILFAAAWLGRREWMPLFLAVGGAAILWAHALAFDLREYVTDPGTGLLSIYAVSPLLWGILAAGSATVAAVAVVRRSRWVWVALSVLMFLGPPRVVLSYLAFLVPAVVVSWREAASSAARQDSGR